MKPKIDIPIYGGTLHILISSDLNKSVDKEGLERKKDLSGYGAVVCFNNDDHYVIINPEDVSGSLIAHECVHLCNDIFARIGAEVDLSNDEPQAYLVGWLYKQIEHEIKKHENRF